MYKIILKKTFNKWHYEGLCFSVSQDELDRWSFLKNEEEFMILKLDDRGYVKNGS
jgi:hypothetical protein